MFHITYTHIPESCPAHDPEKVRESILAMFEGAQDAGVTIESATLDAPAHAFFLSVDADSPQSLQDFLYPALTIGHADTRRVTDALETVRRRGDNTQASQETFACRFEDGPAGTQQRGRLDQAERVRRAALKLQVANSGLARHTKSCGWQVY